MSDPIVPATPVVVAGKNSTTTIHAIISIVAFCAVAVGAKYFGLPDALSGMLATFVSLILVSLGLMQSTDASTTQATASALTDQINSGIAAAKADLMMLHAQNATKIAVNTAQIAVVVPQPVASVPTVISPSPPLVPTQTGGHLVND